MALYSRTLSWVSLPLLLVAVILGPFFVFEGSLTAAVETFLQAQRTRVVLAVVVILLLAADIFLPIPSSIVSTAAGALLGFTSGVVASTTGMTVACMIAHVCGRRFGLPLARRMLKGHDLEEVGARLRKRADWALAAMRPIPVLAEASAVMAGVVGVPFARFLALTALANTGISVVYCAFGAKAFEEGSWLFAIAGSLALPACVLLLRWIVSRFLN